MDIELFDLLPKKAHGSDIMWEYRENIDIFNKYSQIIDAYKCSDTKVEVKKCMETKDVVVCPTPTVPTTAPTTPIAPVTVSTKNHIVRGNVQQTESQIKKNPIELAIEICATDKDYIKMKIMEIISVKEFQTVFGVKKTAEMMKGITENKWNKSLAILFSFLFDISFVYLKKEVVFDSTKKYPNKYII